MGFQWADSTVAHSAALREHSTAV